MQPLDRTEITLLINDFVNKWSSTIVPFYTNNPNNDREADVFGTGFIARCNNRHLLITALHVARDAKKYGVRVMRVGSQAILFENVNFAVSEANDIAIAVIDDLLRSSGIKSIKAIPAYDHTDQEPLGINLLVGFPSSKNKLNKVYGRDKINLLSITVKMCDSPKKLKTHIEKPIYFEYDPHDIYADNLTRTNPPDLHGMSGGPAIQLMQKRTGEQTASVSPRVIGVLSEWHKASRLIVAASLPELQSTCHGEPIGSAALLSELGRAMPR